MRRLLVFSLAYFPMVGGSEVAIREIAKRVHESEFTLVTARFQRAFPKKEVIDRVTVYRVGFGTSLDKFLYPLLAPAKALLLHRTQPFHFVWANMASAGLAALFFTFVRPRVPYLLASQEGDVEEDILRRFRHVMWLYRSIYRRASVLQAISIYLEERARRYGFRGPSFVVPNGVDIPHFSHPYPPHERSELRRRFTSEHDVPIVLTVSRLVKKNGVDALLEAHAELLCTHKALLLIVGAGEDETKLKERTRELAIGPHVRFIGFIPPADLPPYYQIADVFVRPSRQEGFGNVFVEAMAAGVPVVAPLRGGIKDFLTEGITGLVCDPDKPHTIARAIRQILDDKSLAQRLARNGRALVRERYDWEIVARGMESIFHALSLPPLLVAGEIYPPDIGGPATYTREIAHALAREWNVIRVLTYADHDEETHENGAPLTRISRHHPPSPGLRYLRYALRLWRCGRRASLIYAQGPLSSGLPAYITSRLRRIPYAVKIVGDYAWETAEREGIHMTLEAFQTFRAKGTIALLRFLERWVARNADRVIVPSRYLQGIVLQWGVDASRVSVIYNGIAEPPASDAQHSYPSIPQGKLVVFAGRLVPWKGIGELIAQFGRISPERHNLWLLIAGSGPQEPHLKKAAHASGVGARIIFLGAIPRQDLFAILKRSWAFVLYSRYEGFSHTLLDAMLAGVPVIASAIGGNPELIEEGKNGLLVSADDPHTLSSAFERLLNEPALAKELGKAARTTALGFSRERMISKTHKTLVSLIHAAA